MRFDQLLELFAQKYVPLSHDEEFRNHKTFYRIDTWGADNEFIRNFNTAISPAMVCLCNLDGHTVSSGKAVEYRRTCAFISKVNGSLTSSQIQDDDTIATTKLVTLDNMVIDLLGWLRTYKREHPDSLSLRGIDLQNVEWSTIPRLYTNGWCAVFIEFTQTVPINPCINDAMFLA